MSANRESMALAVGSAVGRYLLRGVQPAWGFYLVYEAENASGQRVLLQELLPEELVTRAPDGTVSGKSPRAQADFDWARARFLREGRELAAHPHPGLQKVIEVQEAQGTAYWILVPDAPRSFKRWLQDLGHAPTEAELRGILRPLLAALEHAHAHGLLHLNLKPETIQLTAANQPILIHFAGSRQAIARHSHEALAVTTGYSPPEQYGTETAEAPTADLYSLAAVLHRAIVGQPPVDAEARRAGDPGEKLARRLAGKYSGGFLAAIDAALALDPGARPPTLAAWRRLLGISAFGETVAVLRRHPAWIAGGVAAIFLAAGVLWWLRPQPDPISKKVDSTQQDDPKKEDQDLEAEAKKAEQERLAAEKEAEQKAAERMKAEQEAADRAQQAQEAARQAEAQKRAAEEAARNAEKGRPAAQKEAARRVAAEAARKFAQAQEQAKRAALAQAAAKLAAKDAAVDQAQAERKAAEKAVAREKIHEKQTGTSTKPDARTSAEMAAQQRQIAEQRAAEKRAAEERAKAELQAAVDEQKKLQAAQAAEQAKAQKQATPTPAQQTAPEPTAPEKKQPSGKPPNPGAPSGAGSAGSSGSGLMGVWESADPNSPTAPPIRLTIYGDGRYQMQAGNQAPDRGLFLGFSGAIQMRSDGQGKVVDSTFVYRGLSFMKTRGALGEREWKRVGTAPATDPDNPKK